MVVLLILPAVGVRVSVFVKPLPDDNDISKPAGAVAVILPVKLTPDTVSCCRLGLAEDEPSHAVIVPLAALAVMVGTAGVTVMVNVTGAPLQMVPELTKLPSEPGLLPTITLDIRAPVAELMINNLLSLKLTTYNIEPSALTDMPSGL